MRSQVRKALMCPPFYPREDPGASSGRSLLQEWGDRAILQRVGSEKGVIACKCWVTDVEKFASEESREMEWWGDECRNEK